MGVKYCVVCGKPYAEHNYYKFCSEECRRERKKEQQREYRRKNRLKIKKRQQEFFANKEAQFIVYKNRREYKYQFNHYLKNLERIGICKGAYDFISNLTGYNYIEIWQVHKGFKNCNPLCDIMDLQKYHEIQDLWNDTSDMWNSFEERVKGE